MVAKEVGSKGQGGHRGGQGGQGLRVHAKLSQMDPMESMEKCRFSKLICHSTFMDYIYCRNYGNT